MTIDLKKLEEKLDKLFSDETEESFREWLESKRQLPQQKISDEEILKAAKECRFEDFDISVGSFELGARWYREQLKQRQLLK